MGTSVKILLSVSFLPKHLVGEGTINILRNKNIKEREPTIDLLFHGEFNGKGLIVEILEEIQLLLGMRLNDISVIQKCLPEFGKETGRG